MGEGERSLNAERRRALEALKLSASRLRAPLARSVGRLPDQPGLYAWWVNAAGAQGLSEGLGHLVPPGLIYAGQAGATRWPSGKRSPATLASRIRAGHLGHSIDGSTFRLTLAAILQADLGLEMRTAKYLTASSEAQLTNWMFEHLSVSLYPVATGETLAALEDAVLAELDPPLNLEGMAVTPIRSALSRRRRDLRRNHAPSRRTPRRIGLVGCVKTKAPGRAPAADLYTSALFRGRRRAVESRCDRWFVLSAKHGLIEPTRLVAPYDVTLVRASAGQRRRWAERVLDQIDEAVGSVRGMTFEIHAGSAYSDWGLVAGLRERGARVVQPARGLGLGEQLALYRRRDWRAPSR